jgi:hypothetical protein
MVSDNAILFGLEHWARACLLQIILFNHFLVYPRNPLLVDLPPVAPPYLFIMRLFD